MRSLAIIPCRAGSKRVPGKNWQAIGCRLMAEHAVASAAPCDMTVLSTDDPLIVGIARDLGRGGGRGRGRQTSPG